MPGAAKRGLVSVPADAKITGAMRTLTCTVRMAYHLQSFWGTAAKEANESTVVNTRPLAAYLQALVSAPYFKWCTRRIRTPTPS